MARKRILRTAAAAAATAMLAGALATPIAAAAGAAEPVTGQPQVSILQRPQGPGISPPRLPTEPDSTSGCNLTVTNATPGGVLTEVCR